MSDFHRSLDRALEGHETPNGNVYWFDEAYAWTPPPDRSFVDAFLGGGFTDLTDPAPHAESINREVTRLSEEAIGGAIRKRQEDRYSIRWRDPGPVTREVVIHDLKTIAEVMDDYQRPYLEAVRRYERLWASAWTAVWLAGIDLRPALCEQEIPAEGVE